MYLTAANYIDKLLNIKKKLELEKNNSIDIFKGYIEIIDSLTTNNNDNNYFFVGKTFYNIILNIENELLQQTFDYTKSQHVLRDNFYDLSLNKPIYLIEDKESKLKFLPENEENITIQVVIFISLIAVCGTILLKINSSFLQDTISIIAFTTFFIALNIYFVYAIYTYKKESSHKKTLQTLLHIYNNNQLDSKQKERFLNFFLSEFSSSKEKAPFDLDFLKFQKTKN
ncbi:MAG: hypothetical protein ACOVOQ_13660 [Flavobacterium sp.]